MGTKIVAVEKALDASLTTSHPNVERIIESMKYSLLAGGKRIRPVLCIAACEMFGGQEEVAMPTAVAIEMIHTMSLIHDDLPSMDNDDLRRGKPTNHMLYGEEIAILAGDALLSTSFEHVARETPPTGVEALRIVDVLRRLGTSVGAYGLAGGQVMDLHCENKDDTTREELEWIHIHKTAALLKVSVATGAILGGAAAADVVALETYAEKIGLAFQVRGVKMKMEMEMEMEICACIYVHTPARIYTHLHSPTLTLRPLYPTSASIRSPTTSLT